jgi:hypothetical protein
MKEGQEMKEIQRMKAGMAERKEGRFRIPFSFFLVVLVEIQAESQKT